MPCISSIPDILNAPHMLNETKGTLPMSEIHLPHHHNDNTGSLTDHLKKQLDRTDDFRTVADVFKQLSDSSRIRIFWLLCHCEECVTNISVLMDMSSPAVSHHLRQLRASGLIESRRDGKEVYYKAADTEQSRLLHLTIEKIMEITCSSSLLQSISPW